MRQVADARGRPVALPDRVGRVVSLVPSLTEWLVHAGVGERLVGITDWCAEPAEVVAGLPKVRGTKNPDLGAIRALEPDLVVANAEENRKLDVDRLEAGGLPVFVTMPTTVGGAVGELRDLAAAVGDLPHAAAIDADLVAAVADAYRGGPPAGGVRPRYACAIFRYPPLRPYSLNREYCVVRPYGHLAEPVEGTPVDGHLLRVMHLHLGAVGFHGYKGIVL
jgi:ABC-type Fe3+-hydroxamate transport system substrate-binding protein